MTTTAQALPRAGGPVADRDARYAAVSHRRSRAGRLASTPARAAVESDSAPALVRPDAMPPALTARGLGNTPRTVGHLLSRATFGARPSDYADVRSRGIDAWLERQLDPRRIPDPGGDAVLAAHPLALAPIATVLQAVAAGTDVAQPPRQLATATLGLQIFSSRQLFEVVVDVFSNLLHVTTPSDHVWATAPDYARSVIRAHAFGKYSDMLRAAMRHPAMLIYLDNNQSTRDRLNENLGRELLELHTVGVGAGYTEADVLNSARILTGRGVHFGTSWGFRWTASKHWVGPVRVLGFSHRNSASDDGLAVGDAYLAYLARHPATAQTVARKLAVRFVSDHPPQSLVERLATAYLAHDTAIVPVLRVLFRSSEFWSAVQAKTRRPLEDAVGAVRAVDAAVNPDTPRGLTSLYRSLQKVGHSPLAWAPPDGYPDVYAAWQSASQMVARWNLHRSLTAGSVAGLTPATPLAARLAPTPGMTYRVWIDLVSHTLIGTALDGQRRRAVLAGLEVDGDALVPADPAGSAALAAAYVLDSPFFQLR
ncbi:MAG: DUF1800 domain-containing protein [Dermatophilaceae bacterium]